MKRFLITTFFFLTLLSVFSSCKSEWDTENSTPLTDLLGSTYTFYSASSGGDICGKRYYKIGSEIHESDLPHQFDYRPGYYVDGWTYLKNPADGSTLVPDNIHLNGSGNIEWLTVSPQPVYLAASSWSARGDTPYTVRHLWENVSGTGYDLHESETLYGVTDSLTSASALSYPGFTAQAITQGTIFGDGSTVIEIYYTRDSVTYTFDLDGGTWSLPITAGITIISGRYGASVGAEIPTRPGKIFAGWSPALPSTFGAYDETFTALWDMGDFEITFDGSGGTGSMSPQTVSYGGSVMLTTNAFTKDHYDFDGWSTTPTGSIEYFDNGTFTLSTNDNVTLYAVWSPEIYKISFSANGGYGTMDPQYFSYDTPSPIRATGYTRPGYDFAGWNTEADGSGTLTYMDGGSYSASEDKILYAQWTPKNFTVSFNANGGSGSVASISVPYLTQKNLTPNSFTRAGYEFAGWSTSATGSVEYGNGGIYTMLNSENVTLYAVWAPTTYRVYFYPNGGSGNISFQQFEYGVAQNLDSNTFTRANYTFKGWASSPTATTADYTDGASYTLPTTPPAAIYLYALWEPETYTVTFDSNGATEGSMSPQTFTYGTPDTLTPNAFGKDTCGFSYWNTAADGSGTSYEDEEEISISEDITLYAMWAMFSNIHYDIENSDISITSSESGSKITFTADSGYDSYGWIFDTPLNGRCTSAGNVMTVETSGLWNGTYSVTVYAQKGTMIYSCQATITVD